MYIIVYMSRFARALSSDDVAALALAASAKNDRLGATGVLLHDGHRFMQAIEGDEATLHDLMREIASDSRHHQLAYLYQGFGMKRQFDGWSMRAAQLNPERSQSRLKALVVDLLSPVTEIAIKAAFFGFAGTTR